MEQMIGLRPRLFDDMVHQSIRIGRRTACHG
jgi:hypothetical protein